MNCKEKPNNSSTIPTVHILYIKLEFRSEKLALESNHLHINLLYRRSLTPAHFLSNIIIQPHNLLCLLLFDMTYQVHEISLCPVFFFFKITTTLLSWAKSNSKPGLSLP